MFGRVQKVMQSIAGSIKFIRVVDLKIIISGKIHRNAENLYLRCENIPILWKKYYVKIAKESVGQTDLFNIVVKVIFIISNDIILLYINGDDI